MNLTKAEREFLTTLLLHRANALVSCCEQIGMDCRDKHDIEYMRFLACKLSGKRKIITHKVLRK